jgi:Cupin-like domain
MTLKEFRHTWLKTIKIKGSSGLALRALLRRSITISQTISWFRSVDASTSRSFQPTSFLTSTIIATAIAKLTWIGSTSKRYPMFQEAKILEVTLCPGEVLFLPVGSWHHVRALDISITMTFTNFAFNNDFYSFYRSYDEI